MVSLTWVIYFRVGEKSIYRFLKGGSEFANSSGVSMSELLNWEIVVKTVISELASESMPDDVLIWGDSGGGKTKSGMMGIGFWRLAGCEIEL